MRPTVLVTGGAGFIGSHLVDRLLDSGYRCIAFDNLSTGRLRNVNPRAEFVRGDVTDASALRTLFRRHRISYCIHEAAKINLNVLSEVPELDVKSSVLGTLNLLRLCTEFKTKKLIYASSVAVYGRHRRLPAQEVDEPIPIYSYGIAKKCAEEYIRYYSDTYGLRYGILRYGNVYGPRQPILGEVGVIAIFTDRLLKRKPLTMFGDGHQQRDYIYVDDAIEATVKSLRAADNETLNICGGRGTTVRQLIDVFRQSHFERFTVRRKPLRVGEIGVFYADARKARRLLRWTPRIGLQDGIAKTLAYYRPKDGRR